MTVENDLVRLSLFLACIFAARQLSANVAISPIVIYIIIGALLGPPLANFVPLPDGIILTGMLGIQLSVMEAGLETKLSEIKDSASRAALVAVLGVIFPIGGACLVICIADLIEGRFDTSRSFKTSFAVGAAIAPTSLGVTAGILAECEELSTSFGKLISIAAVVDDVLSLILLSELEAVASAEDKSQSYTWRLFQPIVFAICFIVGGLVVASILPNLLVSLSQRLKLSLDVKSRFCTWILFLTAIALTYTANLAKTSFLLAGYLSGVAFASMPPEFVANKWNAAVTTHVQVLSMLFFAATIGFVIPLKELFSPKSLLLGSLLAVVAVFGKLLCGLGMLPNVVDGVGVAFAMLGRGEFGFLIAATARSGGLLSPRIYAATIWGVFAPTILAPIVVRPVLTWRKRRMQLNNHSNDQSSLVTGVSSTEH